MVALIRLLLTAAVLALAGVVCGCSGQIPADQRIGVSLSVPGMGTGHFGYASGAAAVAQSLPAPTFGQPSYTVSAGTILSPTTAPAEKK